MASALSIKLRDGGGRQVSLASTPLVAFALDCGHVGREYAIREKDVIFCESCSEVQAVARIIA